MANMSYCRFENTANDLEDCIEALEDGKTSSKTEYRAYCRLIYLAQQLIEEYSSLSEEEFIGEEEL